MATLKCMGIPKDTPLCISGLSGPEEEWVWGPQEIVAQQKLVAHLGLADLLLGLCRSRHP